MAHTSAILAGGKSSRMGENKALMQLGRQRVVERIANEMKQLDGNLILIANHLDPFVFLDVPIYADRYLNKGPLAGIESALSFSPEGYVSIAACDTPFVFAGIYRYLLTKAKGKQAVIPFYNGRLHPLSGIYHTGILPVVRECLINNELKLQKVLERIECEVVPSFSGFASDELQCHFFNMNNRSEYEQALNFINC